MLFVESWGQLDPQIIISKALGALKDNLEEFEKSLK